MRKTISFALVHFTVAFSITYLLTGSVLAGGLVAVVEPAINTLAFYLHEKCWQRFTAKPTSPGSTSLMTQPGT